MEPLEGTIIATLQAENEIKRYGERYPRTTSDGMGYRNQNCKG